jgi:D-arginine dehydrogenase
MHVDFAIVGGGISGAAAAYFLSQAGKVALIEQEPHFGFHSSGRTAGQFTVGISADQMRAMAAASRAFFQAPPAGFAELPLIEQRGSLTLGRHSQKAVLDKLHERIGQAGGAAEWVDREQAMALFPALLADKFDLGVHETDAQDIDVNTLLQAYLKGAKRNGAVLATNTPVLAIERQEGKWCIRTQDEDYTASVMVNASGGWADAVAHMAGVAPIGITPYKRTAFTFPLLPGAEGARWPHVCNADYQWYVKPEHGCFMGSPADAQPVAPGEVYPDELDVAQGIYNIEQETTLRVPRPISVWAGVRSYVRDRNPVCGARSDSPDFIWYAALGGCGVLTSPAMGQAVAALAQRKTLPDALRTQGLTPEALSPDRATLRSA